MSAARHLARVLTACSLALAMVSSQAQTRTPVKVEVFLNSTMVLSNAGTATVYRVDGLQMLELELSQGLPANEDQAHAIAQARMRALGSAMQERAKNAATGLALAHQYGVDRLPAVVVDGQAVIYGVTDVAEAIRLWAQGAAKGGR